MTSTNAPSGLSQQMLDYRDFLLAADLKASEAYDKAVMALAGGALGLSLTFVKDIIKTPRPESLWLLETSWGCLTFSLALILVSMLSSQWALRRAIRQVDESSLAGNKVGGSFATLTTTLNLLSGLSFLAGIVLLAYFAIANYS